MHSPPSRRSRYSDFYTSNNLVNYDLVSPLMTVTSGGTFTFPCKGFPKGPPTQIISGNTVQITLEGSAVHNGGHCQFGITYNDRDFAVLKTVEWTCVRDTMTYALQLPDDIPRGEVTIFWTWINSIGNREYYMECADVLLQNDNTNRAVQIVGKELLVANYPGYPQIPEFPRADMYSGLDLLSARKDIVISPSTISTSTSTSSSTSIASSSTSPRTSSETSSTTQMTTSTSSRTSPTASLLPIRQLQGKIRGRGNCTTGEMNCIDQMHFSVCSNNRLYTFDCADGTECQQNGKYILCKICNN